MEILVDPEELIICPYNNSHHIRRKRMAFHLVKCKKNYPDARMVTCDFNVSHQIPEPEIQYHHEHCSNRKDIEITVYMEEGQDINKFPIQNVPVETEDTWDDCNNATYNPKEYCERSSVLRKLDVESAAKRKNFHCMERNRLRMFAENTSLTADVKEEPVKQPIKFRKPTFLPKTPSKPSAGEDTPHAITDLIERIKLGANKPFNSETVTK